MQCFLVGADGDGGINDDFMNIGVATILINITVIDVVGFVLMWAVMTVSLTSVPMSSLGRLSLLSSHAVNRHIKSDVIYQLAFFLFVD